MKKVLYILITLNILSCKVHTGEGVMLNPTLKPGLKYSSIVITENNSTIEYLGNQGIIDNLIAKGIEHPITSISSTVMKSRMITGEIRKNGSFKLECSYDSVKTDLSGSITKLKDGNKLIEKMEGAKAFGSINDNMKIEIDSIVNLKDESLRTTLEQSVSNMLGQIEFPNKKIQIGESFTIKTPMTMPAENGVTEMKIINTYKLDSLDKSIAYFNIEQQIESKTSIDETEFKMEGSGTGKLNYNIEYDTYELYETELVINSIVEVSGIKVKTKAITKSITKTKVEVPDDNKR